MFFVRKEGGVCWIYSAKKDKRGRFQHHFGMEKSMENKRILWQVKKVVSRIISAANLFVSPIGFYLGQWI